MPQIEVTFDIDANGIVHVSAKDLGTGKEQSMTITGGTALGKDEIDRMMKDAEAHAEEDRVKREEAEVRNNADSLVYQTEKLLKEQADKVSADDKEKIEDALKRLKDALAGTDIDAVQAARTRPCSRRVPGVLDAAVPARVRRSRRAAAPVRRAALDAPSDDEVADAEIVDERPADRVSAMHDDDERRTRSRRPGSPTTPIDDG